MFGSLLHQLLLFPTLLQPPYAPPPEAPRRALAPWTPQTEAELLETDPCAELATDCVDIRRLFVDLTPYGEPGGVWLHYDYFEVTQARTAAELAAESELSLAVRLLISEIGADRMLASQESLTEAVGILYTVDNRLDPVVFNPEGRPEAPDFPGCGVTGTFYSCANAQQYLGMATWRALDPLSSYDPAMLEVAVDLAVAAWYLQERGLTSDPTDGATSYVHRCGGAAYAMPTWACDGHLGRPRSDVPGANPHTGPIMFKAPTRWLKHRGHYTYEPVRFVDYVPWHPADDAEAI